MVVGVDMLLCTTCVCVCVCVYTYVGIVYYTLVLLNSSFCT